MNRKIKALGLALVAVIAMSALSASAASAADEFTAAAYPALAKGSQEGATNYFEATPGNKTECKVATYQGTLAAASKTITVTPHYAECTAAGLPTTIHLNGCDFLFHTTGTNASNNVIGTADVVCPVGGTIEITVGSVCQVHVKPQTGLTGVTFKNVANGDVTVEVDITNQIKYVDTDTPSSLFCPFTNHTFEGANGSFVSNVLLEGFEDSGLTTGPTGANTTYKEGPTRNIDVL